MAPRETENNAYAIVGVSDKQKALWYVVFFWYFLEWSMVTARSAIDFE